MTLCGFVGRSHLKMFFHKVVLRSHSTLLKILKKKNFEEFHNFIEWSQELWNYVSNERHHYQLQGLMKKKMEENLMKNLPEDTLKAFNDFENKQQKYIQ